MRRFLPVFAALACSFLTVGAQQITCFGFGGNTYPNNTRCPGSNTCCGHTATCLSNRLCHNEGDGAEKFVRGPCAVKSWDSTCGQICRYNETEIGGNLLPRVTPCADGSLCCDNDPQCCGNKRGVFLDQDGFRVAAAVTAATTSYPPLDDFSRFTLTPLTSSSVPTPFTTTVQTTLPTDSASSGNPAPSTGDSGLGTKVGLGIGIPAAVLAVAAAVFFHMRRRRNGTQSPHELETNGGHSGQSGTGWKPQMAYHGQAVTEMSTPSLTRNDYASPPPPPMKDYYAGPPPPPVEIGSRDVAELPATRRYELG